MEKVRRQHYVPRMYLKRFGYGNIGDEYISVLKLDNGTVLDNRKVENFAVANYFYDADKEQIAEILKEDLKVFPELCDNENLSDDQFTEHVLAREESAISKMLNELQEDLSTIHISSNRNLMIIFLHSLAYRTKQFRDQMDAINNKTEKWLSSMCDNLGLDEETKKKTIEINCSTGKNTQLYQILGIKPVLETMQMLQYNYEWYEAVNNTELDFVISDNPAQTVRNGFNDICIPVSSNKAIIFRIKDKTAPLISRVQHYKEAKTREKVGTRLIDFTKSVDVALYFACCEEDNDGAVFVQSIVPHKEEWYTVHILLEIANLESEKVNVRELTDILWSKYSLFSERFEDKGMVDNAITALIDFGIMIIPEKETLIQNKRMCAQEGCLWICGNRLDDRNQIRTSLTSKSMYFYPNDYCVPEWFCDHRDLLKIVIPKRKKEEFLCKLSDKNISRESLFPD